MAKHIIGQAIYQLIILNIILFVLYKNIYEYDESYIDFAYHFAYCFGNISHMNYDGPIENRNFYLISGLESQFSNSTNITYPTNSSCPEFFKINSTSLNEAYSYFLQVFIIIIK